MRMFVKFDKDPEMFRARFSSATQCADNQDMTNGRVFKQVGEIQLHFETSPIQESIINRVKDFYTQERVEAVLRPIIEQSRGSPSIRSIDWFLTNYSKSKKIICTRKDGRKENIYTAYKTVLNFYRRRNFDAFRRKLRIVVESPEGNITTTIAQLNFYEWAYTHGVLDYCKEHAKHIEMDMNSVASMSKRFKHNKKPGDRRRSELSKASMSKVSIYEQQRQSNICAT